MAEGGFGGANARIDRRLGNAFRVKLSLQHISPRAQPFYTRAG